LQGFIDPGHVVDAVGNSYLYLSNEYTVKTAHMVLPARSKSSFGLWENSLYNPIVHPNNRNKLWCCQGLGTLDDYINGNW